MNTTTSGDAIVAGYLRNVDLLLDHLPRARRQEILDGLAEHIAAARAELDGEREEDVTTILARVGTPEQIAAAEAEDAGEPLRPRAGGVEIVTLITLLAGIVMLPFVSLFIGTGVMWFSRIWSRRDKLRVTSLAALAAAAPVGYVAIIATIADDETLPALGIIGLILTFVVWLGSIVVSPILAAWLLGRHVWPIWRRPAETVTFSGVPAEQLPTGASPMVWPMVPPPPVDEAAVARRRKVRNRLYASAGIALVASVLALVLGIGGLVGSFPNNGAARVSAPGTVSLTLDEPGEYEIAHEYEPSGETDEDGFTDPPGGSPTVLTLRGEDGSIVPVRPALGQHRYSTLHRQGKSLAAFTITVPGRYELTSGYPGTDGPPTTLVVGQDSGDEWSNVLLLMIGIFVGMGGLVLLVIALIVHLTAPRPPKVNGSA